MDWVKNPLLQIKRYEPGYLPPRQINKPITAQFFYKGQTYRSVLTIIQPLSKQKN